MLPKQKKLDPRVIRTRRDLAASMCTLMRQKSFNQITVQEIAEQALINRATFYAHFEDKFGLLEYMVRGSFREKLKSKIATCDGFKPEHLRLLMLATCEFLEEFNDSYAPRRGDDHPPLERLIQPLIYRVLLGWAEKSGLGGSATQSAETIVMATSWTIFGSALQWSRSAQKISAETLTNQIMSLLLQGLNPIL